MLLSRVWDAVRLCERRGAPQFVGFLDERQAALAESEAKKAGCGRARCCGGYEDAERVILGIFPEDREPERSAFPIVPLTAAYRPCDRLTHRDFLGSLMALGIERSTLGDVLVEDGRAVIFAHKDIAPYILSQMEKVGRVGVALTEGAQNPYPSGRGFQRIEGTIPSMRLDAVIAAVLHISREKSAALILSGQVQLRFTPAQSLSAQVGAGDKLSIRGYGRYTMEQIGVITRKGRYKFSVRKYI